MNSEAPDPQSDAGPVHEPLSQSLARLLDSIPPGETLTFNHLLSHTDGRGIFLVLILMNLPFLFPMPLFGLSTVMGLFMAVLGIRIALRLPPKLPKRVGERPLPDKFRERVLGGSVKVLQRLERWVKPRKDVWLSNPWVLRFNGGLIAFLAFLISLPLPPIILFTNSVPAYGIILLCLSMMEEDGVLIWWAYAEVVGTVIFFTLIFAGSGALIVKHWKTLVEMVQSLT